MKFLKIIVAGLSLLAYQNVHSQSMGDEAVYELRTYTSNEGKFEAMNNRFRDHTIALFDKHGLESMGYWIPVDKKNTLIYILKHKSLDGAKEAWKNFANDPEWKKVAQESGRNGPILAQRPQSQFMSATDYSKGMPAGRN